MNSSVPPAMRAATRADDGARSRASAAPRGAALAALALLLTACSSLPSGDGPPARHVDVSDVPDAVPRAEPYSRYGNPDSYVVFGERYHVRDTAVGYRERGIASWYGTKFHGKRTSSGEPYDMYAMTAAHKTLPLPTYARVTNLDNGRSVTLKINDRGPFHDNRIIDLSYAAARKLGVYASGTARVEVAAIVPGADETATREARAPADDPIARIAARAEADAIPALPAADDPRYDKSRLFLQVGAFSDEANAEALRRRLRAADIDEPVAIEPGDARGDVYRVRIGPLAGVEDADRLTRRLTDLGLARPIVVVD